MPVEDSLEDSFSNDYAVAIAPGLEPTFLYIWPESHKVLLNETPPHEYPHKRLLVSWGDGDLLIMHPNTVHAGYMKAPARMHMYLFAPNHPHSLKSKREQDRCVDKIANSTVILSAFGDAVVKAFNFEK
jgi:hypothetical protein